MTAEQALLDAGFDLADVPFVVGDVETFDVTDDLLIFCTSDRVAWIHIDGEWLSGAYTPPGEVPACPSCHSAAARQTRH